MDKIAIWTPINVNSGLGHFYRMLGLYEELVKDGYSVYYFTNKEFLNTEIINIRTFLTNDIKKIVRYLLNCNTKVLIIDNYDISRNDILRLNEYFKVIYFDAGGINPEVDAILNFNPYSIDKYPIKHKNTNYFLGLEYMKFRQSIINVKKTSMVENSIFVSIGGSDVASVTYEMIPYLPKDRFYNIVLGVGCSEKYFKKVFSALESGNLDFSLFHQPEDYFRILLESEFALISCSTTSYELSYFSKPFACINVIENQNEISDYLNDQGICTLVKSRIDEVYNVIAENRFSLLKDRNKISIKFGDLANYIKGLVAA